MWTTLCSSIAITMATSCPGFQTGVLPEAGSISSAWRSVQPSLGHSMYPSSAVAGLGGWRSEEGQAGHLVGCPLGEPMSSCRGGGHHLSFSKEGSDPRREPAPCPHLPLTSLRSRLHVLLTGVRAWTCGQRHQRSVHNSDS